MMKSQRLWISLICVLICTALKESRLTRLLKAPKTVLSYLRSYNHIMGLVLLLAWMVKEVWSHLYITIQDFCIFISCLIYLKRFILFKILKLEEEKWKETKIIIIRSDSMENTIKSIVAQYTMPRAPKWNDVASTMNRMLMAIMRNVIRSLNLALSS